MHKGGMTGSEQHGQDLNWNSLALESGSILSVLCSLLSHRRPTCPGDNLLIAVLQEQ